MVLNDVTRLLIVSLTCNLQIPLIYSFPNGSYLKSLSIPSQFHDGKEAKENVASESVASKKSVESSSYGGFGQPPLSTINNDVRIVDPYVAAYAAFQQQQKELTEAKQSLSDQASAASLTGTISDNSYSVSNMQTEPTTSTDVQQNSMAPMGISSYLNSLSTTYSTPSITIDSTLSSISTDQSSRVDMNGFTNELKEESSSISAQAIDKFSSSITTLVEHDAAAQSIEQESNLMTEIPESQNEVSNVSPFVTGILYSSFDTEQLDKPLVYPEKDDEPRHRATWNVGSYLERLAQNPVSIDADSTAEASPVNDDVILQVDSNRGAESRKDIDVVDDAEYFKTFSSSSQNIEEKVTRTLNTAFKTSRPLIPIHAIKVEDNRDALQFGEKPFFTSFSPKPPIRNINKQSRVSESTKQSRISRIFDRTDRGSRKKSPSSYERFKEFDSRWSELNSTSLPIQYDSSLISKYGTGKSSNPLTFVSEDITLGSSRAWSKLRSVSSRGSPKLDFDAVVCGGSLALFVATALSLKGHKVCVVDNAQMDSNGDQEWNMSKEELQELIRMGILSQDDVNDSISSEFSASRIGFKNLELSPLTGSYRQNGVGYESISSDVLNVGVSPSILMDRVKKRFIDNGGNFKTQSQIEGVVVSERVGAALDLGKVSSPITTRLVLDCMGHDSPITRQQRSGEKPDGVCAMVGSCAGGFSAETNVIGDIIYTNSEMKECAYNGKLQYFWEAFPVNLGGDSNTQRKSDIKTTYMFTYFDANQERPSLEMLMNDYLEMLPTYQKSIVNVEEDLDFKRLLYAYFPTYKDSPLKPQWNRILAVGDAAGIQSPLSFGGFGSLVRHLDRITTATSEALDDDLLLKDDLAEINAYQPNLSAAWMFQKAMSIRTGQETDTKFVNRLLATNLEVMNDQGLGVKPFVQDPVRFNGFASSLSGSLLKDPSLMQDMIQNVGIKTFALYVCHVAMMGIYAMLHGIISPLISPFLRLMKNARNRFQWKRRMESWKYGSGIDEILSQSDKFNM